MGISGIANIIQKGVNYSGRLIFDDKFSSKVASRLKAQGRIYKKSGKGRFYKFHKQVGSAFERAYKLTEKNPVTGKKIGVFDGLKNSLRSYGKDVTKLWGSNKSFFSKIGGTLKGLAKRAPLIGTALMVAFEIPNIVKATKDGGLIKGAAEIAKSGVRIASGVACGAIGTALIGPIGGILGFIVGDMLAKFVVGKSYSEKKAAEQEEIKKVVNEFSPANNFVPQNMTLQPTLTPQQLLMLQQMLYNNNDFLYNTMKNSQNKLDLTM